MRFIGQVPSSKSLFNRALITQSLNPDLKIFGQSESDDVKLMEQAVAGIKQGNSDFFCGHAGTVLRFLAPRLAREEGAFCLRGSERLFQRPQKPLENLLLQLGAIDIQWTSESLSFKSQGWKLMGDGIHLNLCGLLSVCLRGIVERLGFTLCCRGVYPRPDEVSWLFRNDYFVF